MATIAPNTPASPVPQGGSDLATNIPENRRRSGSFTNLQSYIRANQSQAPVLANQVAGDLEKRNEQARKEIETERDRVQTAAGAVGPQVGQGEQAELNIKDTIRTAGRENNQPLPQGATRPLGSRELFEGLRGADFSGIKFDASEAAQRGRETEQEAAGLGTTQGIQTAVGKTFQRPRYTQGEKRLDTFILQSAPESRGRFAEVQKNVIGKTDPVFSKAVTDANNAITNRQNEITNLLKFADEELGRQLNAEYDRLEGERNAILQGTQQGRKSWEDEYARQGALPAGGTTGLSLDELLKRTNLPGVSETLNQFLPNYEEQIKNLRTEQLLTPQEQARLNALYQLQSGDYEGPGKYRTAEQVSPQDFIFNVPRADINARIGALKNQAIGAINTQVTDLAKNAFALPSGADNMSFRQAIDANTTGSLTNNDVERTERMFQQVQNSVIPQIQDVANKYGLNLDNSAKNIDTLLRNYYGFNDIPPVNLTPGVFGNYSDKQRTAVLNWNKAFGQFLNDLEQNGINARIFTRSSSPSGAAGSGAVIPESVLDALDGWTLPGANEPVLNPPTTPGGQPLPPGVNPGTILTTSPTAGETGFIDTTGGNIRGVSNTPMAAPVPPAAPTAPVDPVEAELGRGGRTSLEEAPRVVDPLEGAIKGETARMFTQPLPGSNMSINDSIGKVLNAPSNQTTVGDYKRILTTGSQIGNSILPKINQARANLGSGNQFNNLDELLREVYGYKGDRMTSRDIAGERFNSTRLTGNRSAKLDSYTRALNTMMQDIAANGFNAKAFRPPTVTRMFF